MYTAAKDRYSRGTVRHAGKTGLMLPPISLGLWKKYGSQDPFYDRKKVILHAFDKGIFHFDNANHYGDGDFGSSEKLLGQILNDELKPYRDELVISTKVGYEIHDGPYGIGTSRKSLIQGINDSLTRLNLDYVDIYYAHRYDDLTPISETVHALDDIVKSGKALYVGVSNFEKPQLEEAIRLFKQLGTPFVLDQMSMNILNNHVENSGIIDVLKNNGAGAIAYGPLSEGLLSDRYLNGIPDSFKIHHTNQQLFDNGKDVLVKKLNDLNDIAKNRDQTLSQMSLAWLLRDPVVASVIIGTTSIEHLDDNLKTLDNLDFSQDEIDAIDKLIK
ncbi:aldo keto reductase [Companilactobacillus mindensis DSM 14500]|uniref:Aldo keto reductase n=1 Tax=Companilactobacillus mindensis DSM 14500 TaxID=1423770 RepID=A0A0R1QJW8_9LACO|nr:aldo/keto reductase [Companilactobacillus mindensis]KRL44801.1 aldo keto reductase [Companilactobacillus mindensis DSM 14500]GEO78020.1 glyceraldehyde 3-phosphate reductase [Companilactobacillus mindensis]